MNSNQKINNKITIEEALEILNREPIPIIDLTGEGEEEESDGPKLIRKPIRIRTRPNINNNIGVEVKDGDEKAVISYLQNVNTNLAVSSALNEQKLLGVKRKIRIEEKKSYSLERENERLRNQYEAVKEEAAKHYEAAKNLYNRVKYLESSFDNNSITFDVNGIRMKWILSPDNLRPMEFTCTICTSNFTRGLRMCNVCRCALCSSCYISALRQERGTSLRRCYTCRNTPTLLHN
jgi:hypothetical protein